MLGGQGMSNTQWYRRDGNKFHAYYFEIDATGVDEIDHILDAVARAGKAFHSTDSWHDNAYDDGTPVEWIESAARLASNHITTLEAKVKVLRDAAQKFVDQVDAGLALSTVNYKRFKKALAACKASDV